MKKGEVTIEIIGFAAKETPCKKNKVSEMKDFLKNTFEKKQEITEALTAGQEYCNAKNAARLIYEQIGKYKTEIEKLQEQAHKEEQKAQAYMAKLNKIKADLREKGINL